MMAGAQIDTCTCPRCGTTGTKGLVAAAGYHCPRCAFQLAHLEFGPTGSVRRVLGWMRSPGDVVGARYVVTTVLGKGGFAAVYLVEDQKLRGKRRALKEIPEHLYDDQETALLSRLRHRGVPDIVDHFEADGMVYLVLEFGGTRTLEGARRASGGHISLDQFRPWMQQLCDVLAYLHAQTPPIVHRDLKPSNVLLDEHERVMLIDFGIAKESIDAGATRTLARAVTHGFSPPEQILGGRTDARSDIYALGATMYLLLTGTVPPPAHERLNGRELAAPGALNPEIPADLEAVILRALDLRPEGRPTTVRAIRDAVEGKTPLDEDATTIRPGAVTLFDPGTTVSAVRPLVAVGARRATAPEVTRRRRTRIGVAVAAAVGLATVGSWLGLRRQDADEIPSPTPRVAVPVGTEPEPTIPTPPSTAVSLPATTIVTIPPVTSTTTPPDVGTRILRALDSHGLDAVSVVVYDDHILLGNLRNGLEERQARQIVAALPGIDLPVEATLPPPPPAKPVVKPRPQVAPKPPARQRNRPPDLQKIRSRPRSRRPHASLGSSAPEPWVLIPQPARRTD